MNIYESRHFCKVQRKSHRDINIEVEGSGLELRKTFRSQCFIIEIFTKGSLSSVCTCTYTLRTYLISLLRFIQATLCLPVSDATLPLLSTENN